MSRKVFLCAADYLVGFGGILFVFCPLTAVTCNKKKSNLKPENIKTITVSSWQYKSNVILILHYKVITLKADVLIHHDGEAATIQ